MTSKSIQWERLSYLTFQTTETKKDDSVPERAKSGVKKQGTRSPTKNRTATWYEYVQSLAAFKANHGHLKVPHDFIDPDNDLELGLWVKYLQKEYIAKQKNPRYRSQFLTHRRQAVLDSMGFEWEIIRMPGSPTTPTSKDFKSGTGMKDPSSWGHDYIYNMNQDCSSFCDWAEKEIALLEPMIQSPNSDESSAFLTYPEFEATFRVCLLKLSTERYPQRLKKIKMES